MDIQVDHYKVLGLPSGEDGAKLTEKEISKAYKLKALVLHPDKRPDDPNAHDNFQKLKTSYEVLKDEKARKLFDDLLAIKREQERRHSQQDAKRRKMKSDLEGRENEAFSLDPDAKARREEERISRKLKEEIERIRAKHANKGASTASKREAEGLGKQNAGSGARVELDKERMLKVTWENVGLGYSAEKLREFLSEFGEVEDVVIRSTKKKGSAIVVMSSKEAAIAATGTMCGDLSNPLLVIPLQRAAAMEFPSAAKSVETERLSNLVGAGYQTFENNILQRLKEAAKKQKGSPA